MQRLTCFLKCEKLYPLNNTFTEKWVACYVWFRVEGFAVFGVLDITLKAWSLVSRCSLTGISLLCVTCYSICQSKVHFILNMSKYPANLISTRQCFFHKNYFKIYLSVGKMVWDKNVRSRLRRDHHN